MSESIPAARPTSLIHFMKGSSVNHLIVSLRYDAPLWVLLKIISRRANPDAVLLEFDEPDEAHPESSALLGCIEAHQDGFGFVRLVLNQEGNDPGDIPQSISVPQHLVAWISEETKRPTAGFLADWRSAT